MKTLFAALLTLPVVLVALAPQSFDRILEVRTFLVWHNVVEFASVIVAFSIFGIAWFGQGDKSKPRVVWVSSLFFIVGVLDFMHALSYPGMPDFVTLNSANKTLHFWLFARLFTALALLSITLPYFEKSRRVPFFFGVFFSIAIPSTIYFVTIYFPQTLPETFVVGTGLTFFKKMAEWVIIALFATGLYFSLTHRWRSHGAARPYYILGVYLCILSEIIFTLYSAMHDTINLLGHAYKFAAYYFIYKGLFVSAIERPQRRIESLNERLFFLLEKYRNSERRTLNLSQALTRVQDNERKMIAHELHENLNQTLSLISLEIQTYVSNLPPLPSRKSINLQKYIRDALHTTNIIAMQLNPNQIETLGLKTALEDLIKEHTGMRRFQSTVLLGALTENVPPEWGLHIFRILQGWLLLMSELSTATAFTLRAVEVRERIMLTATHNGVPRDTTESEREGILIRKTLIEARSKIFGGAVHFFAQSPGETMELSVPKRKALRRQRPSAQSL